RKVISTDGKDRSKSSIFGLSLMSIVMFLILFRRLDDTVKISPSYVAITHSYHSAMNA
ncbi:hypothetical protein COCCADRAFT_111089, partial [Bipolaris zeicola 26-R-13]